MKLARPLAALLVVIVALVCLRLVGERAGAPERGRSGSDVSGGAEPRSDSSADVELAAQPSAATRDVVTPADLGGTHLVVVDDTGAPVDDARVRWVTADSAATVGEGAALPSDGRYLVLVERDGLVPRADFVDAQGATHFVLLRGARIELRLLGDLPEWTRFEALLERAEATDAPRDDEFAYSDSAQSRRQRIERALDGAASAKERVAETKQIAKDGAIGSVAVFERLSSTESRSLVWAALEPGRYRYRVESPKVDGDAGPRPNHTAYMRPYSPTIVAKSGDAFTFDAQGRAPARLTGRFVAPASSGSSDATTSSIEISLSRGVERSWTAIDSASSPDGAFDFHVDDPADFVIAARRSTTDSAWCAQVTALGLAAGEWRNLGDVYAAPTTLRVVFAPFDVEGRALQPNDVLVDVQEALSVEVRTSYDSAPVHHAFAFDASRPFDIHGLTPARAFVRLMPSRDDFAAAPFEPVMPLSVFGLGAMQELDVAGFVEARFAIDFLRPSVDRALAIAFEAPLDRNAQSSFAFAYGSRRDGSMGPLAVRDDRLEEHNCRDVYGAQPGTVLFVQFTPNDWVRLGVAPLSAIVLVRDDMIGGLPQPMSTAGSFVLSCASGSEDPGTRFELAAPASDTWLELPLPLKFGRSTDGAGLRTQAWCLPLGWRVRSVDGKLAATLPSAVELGTEVVVELLPVE